MAATSASAAPLPGGGVGQGLPLLSALLAFVRRTFLVLPSYIS
ncbi:hypothetical protein AB0436_08040 [Streptomyces sp. NPDC051322]